jgi:hypothetical protein
MSAVAIIPLVGAVIGLLMFLLAGNPKTSEIGKIVFATALLVTWLSLAGKVVRF